MLIHEFRTNPESHKALVCSIESVLKELPENGETWTFEIAEMIANRIIGNLLCGSQNIYTLSKENVKTVVAETRFEHSD